MRNTVLAYEIFAALLIAGLMGAQTSIAQTVGGYPDWSVNKAVPCAVGSPTEGMALVTAQKLSEDLARRSILTSASSQSPNSPARLEPRSPDGGGDQGHQHQG
jgi:hypothetical protein